LSYVANCGVRDVVVTGNSVYAPDRATNGIFQNHYAFRAPGGTELSTWPAIVSKLVVRVSASDIKDGADSTILLSENLQAWQWCFTTDNSGMSVATRCSPESLFGMIWGVNASTYPAYPKMINTNKTLAESNYYLSSDNYAFARPSSNHDNGVNVAFCDGHVSFLRENVAYTVFAQLMSPDGQRITNPSTANSPLVTRSATSAWYKPIPADTFD
jgi:prepilin-type processing-associated H-X9-DG protein